MPRRYLRYGSRAADAIAAAYDTLRADAA